MQIDDVTRICHVFYDNQAASYANAIKLLGDNEDVFSSARNKPNVLLDGCKVRKIIQRIKHIKIIIILDEIYGKQNYI